MKNKLNKLLIVLIFFFFPFGHLVKFSPFLDIGISLIDVLVWGYVFFNIFTKSPISKNTLLFREFRIFIVICLLSLLINIFNLPRLTLIKGLFYLTRFTGYSGFFLYLVNWLTKDHKIFITNCLLFGSVALGMFGLLQYFLYPDLRNLLYLGYDPHFYRVFSTMFDPNFCGIILVFCLFLLLFRFSEIKSLQGKLFHLFLLILISIAGVLTYSRSAYLAFIAGLGIYFIGNMKLRKNLILFGFLLLLFFVLVPKPPNDVISLTRIYSSLSRLNNWRESLFIGLNHPLLGIGFGTIKFPDSSFLYVFSTTGFIGLFTFVCIWKRILSFAVKSSNKLLIISVALLVSSFFNNSLFYPWVILWYFGFLATESAISRK